MSDPTLETTAQLLADVRAGEPTARDRLVRRYLPILTRWARGRLPATARSLAETDDLVQTTLIRALNHAAEFDARREGAFLAYLRQIAVNVIRDEIRRASARPISRQDEPGEDIAARAPSPLEEAIGADALERYEAALQRLADEQREAVVLWVEMGFSYEQIAEALERPSVNAARMFVTRSLARLAEVMNEPD